MVKETAVNAFVHGMITCIAVSNLAGVDLQIHEKTLQFILIYRLYGVTSRQDITSVL